MFIILLPLLGQNKIGTGMKVMIDNITGAIDGCPVTSMVATSGYSGQRSTAQTTSTERGIFLCCCKVFVMTGVDSSKCLLVARTGS